MYIPKTVSSLVKVKIGELRGNAATINKQIEDLRALNARLDALLIRIGDSWTGQSGTSFIRAVQNYKNQCETMLVVLEEFKKYADEAAKQFDDVDRECADIIRNSF